MCLSVSLTGGCDLPPIVQSCHSVNATYFYRICLVCPIVLSGTGLCMLYRWYLYRVVTLAVFECNRNLSTSTVAI